jgi:hypothetical protein
LGNLAPRRSLPEIAVQFRPVPVQFAEIIANFRSILANLCPVTANFSGSPAPEPPPMWLGKSCLAA